MNIIGAIDVYKRQGLLVVGTSEVNGENVSKKYGIKINDRIEKINNQLINSTEEFSKTVNENPSGVALSIKRDNQDILINACLLYTSRCV